MAETRVIPTGLSGPVNKDILDSVIGQLSDGKWENVPMMRKYWKYANIEEQNGQLVIVVEDNWESGFRGKDEAWIKSWFAGKIKEIVYDEFGGERWNRTDKRPSDYLGRRERPITIADAYKAYEVLKGRKVKAEKTPEPAAPATPSPAPATPKALVNQLLDEPDYRAD